MARGRPGQGALIVPRPSGGQWTREDWGQLAPARLAPSRDRGLVTGDLWPYRLRGAFVSLLLWEGRSRREWAILGSNQ